MRILVGNHLFDSSETPMLVYFEQAENSQFRNDPPANDIFCSCPSGWTERERRKWMETNKMQVIRGPVKTLNIEDFAKNSIEDVKVTSEIHVPTRPVEKNRLPSPLDFKMEERSVEDFGFTMEETKTDKKD